VSDESSDSADDLSDELARKYDPERLLGIVSKRAGRGEPLEASVRARYERRFGVDLSHVRVYSGEFAEEFNRQRNAYAVTIGTTGMILMGGSPDRSMASASGQALLAHELTHVAQARRGMSFKSMGGGMPFAEEHEAEAEAVEHAVLQEHTGVSPGDHPPSGGDEHKTNQHAAKQKDAAIAKIKERVMDLLADTARSQAMRNGPARRP
jgi:uncharacterized protein DUF4157